MRRFTADSNNRLAGFSNQILLTNGPSSAARHGAKSRVRRSWCGPALPRSALDVTRTGRNFSGMDHVKKKLSGSSAASTNRSSLGFVIAFSAAVGVVIGSAGTYFLSRPPVAPKPSASPAPEATPLLQAITAPPQQQQFTPAPQPPGLAPPGKVWSVEHGHWHDAPVAQTIPAPAPATVNPPTTTILAPVAAPAEKKE